MANRLRRTSAPPGTVLANPGSKQGEGRFVSIRQLISQYLGNTVTAAGITGTGGITVTSTGPGKVQIGNSNPPGMIRERKVVERKYVMLPSGNSGSSLPSLTNGDIWVGNASNVATAVAPSGDVTMTNAGAFTIVNGAVTYAKIQNVTDARLIGRSSGSAGPPIEITVGSGLSLSGGSLAASSVSSIGAKVLISEIVTSGSQSVVTFSSIPGTYRDLELRIRGRGTAVLNEMNPVITFNSDTTSGHYSHTQAFFATGAGFTNTTSDTGILAIQLPAASGPASITGYGYLTIADYANTTLFKTFAGNGQEQESTMVRTIIYGGYWHSTAAITRIDVTASPSGGFVDGSVVSLYGHY